MSEWDKLFSTINMLETTSVEVFQPEAETAALSTQVDNSIVVEPKLSLSTFNVDCRYIEDAAEVPRFVSLLVSRKTTIAIDIETYGIPEVLALDLPKPMKKQIGLDPHLSQIRLVQMFDGDQVYVFDIKAIGGLELLQPLWEKTFVAHNGIFELQHLLHKRAHPKRLGCTMLQANVLFGGMWSLKDLAKEVLDIELSKEQQVSDWSAEVLTQEQIEYAALDAVVTKKIFDKQHEMIKEKQFQPIYELLRNCQHVIAKMELDGLHIDIESHAKLVTQWREEFVHLEAELRKVVGELNPNSPQQIAAWLQAHLPEDILKKWPKTETGHLKSDIDTLLLFSELEIVKPQVAYKEMSKRISSYGDGFAQRINPITKRIHASFKLGGTSTGRFSCRDPNVQNIPRDKAYRALFCAPAGKKIVVADFSQLELRVAALISGDPVMMAVYSSGEDLHRKTAAAVLGVEPEAVTKEQRQMAKAVNFGFLFGQRARGFVKYAKTTYGVNMTEKEASAAKDVFLKTYKRLAAWQEQTIAMAGIHQTVKTRAGRLPIRELAPYHKAFQPEAFHLFPICAAVPCSCVGSNSPRRHMPVSPAIRFGRTSPVPDRQNSIPCQRRSQARPGTLR